MSRASHPSVGIHTLLLIRCARGCSQAKFNQETGAGRRLQVVNTYAISGATRWVAHPADVNGLCM
jgi:hypothetical protein